MRIVDAGKETQARAHIYIYREREKIEIKISSRYETNKNQERHFLVFEIRQNFVQRLLIDLLSRTREFLLHLPPT